MINTTGPSIDETTILPVLFRATMVASDAAVTHTTTVTRTGDYCIFDRILSMEIQTQYIGYPTVWQTGSTRLYILGTATPVHHQYRFFQYRALIHQILLPWLSSWNQWKMTSDMLQSAIDILQTDLWDTYQDFHQNHNEMFQIQRNHATYADLNRNETSQNFLLPSVEAIQCRLEEMNRL